MTSGQPQTGERALPADLQAIFCELDRSDQAARQITSELSEAQLNWQPAGGAWSVAECLDHLAQMNSVYTAALRAAVHRAGRNSLAPRRPIQPGWFGRWFIHAMEPPPRRKMKTPKQGAPGLHKTADEILRAFIAAHNELRSLIQEARDLDLNRIRFRNPFVGWIRFTVGTGMLIIGAHDRRHLWQANQVRAEMQSSIPGFRSG